MELGADIPSLFRNLDDFHQVGSGINAHTLHARSLIFILVLVVELIAMAMPLLD